MYVFASLCICIYMYVYGGTGAEQNQCRSQTRRRRREKERERKKHKERERKRDKRVKESVCVCVRERESEWKERERKTHTHRRRERKRKWERERVERAYSRPKASQAPVFCPSAPSLRSIIAGCHHPTRTESAPLRSPTAPPFPCQHIARFHRQAHFINLLRPPPLHCYHLLPLTYQHSFNLRPMLLAVVVEEQRK